ncbi:hypothetical protein, partial [Klebsiella pneumoniae]|uniref:hypothetical protein n=1 Tax=Klebsiella pneumoniae TaxID=573 RepID=UPI00226E2E6C
MLIYLVLALHDPAKPILLSWTEAQNTAMFSLAGIGLSPQIWGQSSLLVTAGVVWTLKAEWIFYASI